MGAPILGREKSFVYGTREWRMRWEMEPFSGNVYLIVLRQDGNGEWWIRHQLGPFISLGTAAKYPGGIPAYVKTEVLPKINADIARLVTEATADAARDPVTGAWPNSLSQIDALLMRSIDVNVATDGSWALQAKY